MKFDYKFKIRNFLFNYYIKIENGRYNMYYPEKGDFCCYFIGMTEKDFFDFVKKGDYILQNFNPHKEEFEQFKYK